MDVSLESLNSFRPRTGTMEAWNAAYVRVEDYLRAHRITTGSTRAGSF